MNAPHPKPIDPTLSKRFAMCQKSKII